ncbi:MAG: hypothetical protein Kow00104_02050 [Rhodothalassiaceae bacterium]
MSFGFRHYVGFSVLAAVLAYYLGFALALLVTILLALAPAIAAFHVSKRRHGGEGSLRSRNGPEARA